MRYGLLFAILCLFGTTVCQAQRRQIGDARTILKSGKNAENAEKMMLDLLKDSAHHENIRIYDIWLQSVEKQYAQVNEKMYMQQPVDTARLFELTMRIFTIGERLDSLDMKPDRKGKVNLQYRDGNARRLAAYRPNLFNGGAYELRASRFQSSFDFFEKYLDCDRQPLFTGYDFMGKDPRMGEAAYWATYCGFRMNDPVLTLRHAQLACRDTARQALVLQYAAEAWRQLGDDSTYMETLWKGFRLYPHSVYFFPRLMDSYTAKGNYEKALAVADEALAVDSVNELFLFAKSTMLLSLGRYEECLCYSQRIIDRNDQMADAYYNAGTACLNLALGMDPRQNKKQVRRMYQQALPYMESYRRLAPQERHKWGQALYRIYFNLNMGKQFDEIDKILKK